MPNTWIKRSFESIIEPPSKTLALFPVWLFLGPRQVGKSALLLHCAKSDRQMISLDDLDQRMRANQDPVLFLKNYKFPILIDEIQYAPKLLSEVKLRVDKGVPSGSVWLTGSQSFEVMKGIQETLAGRVGIFNLYGLSDHEKKVIPQTPHDYFLSILESGFPKLFGVRDIEARASYLSSYLQTYIERDVRELLGIQKRREFEFFLKLCALRSGQVINYADLARDAGISSVTAKEWVSLLEDSFLIKCVQPYYSNRSKRLIKSPKLFFLDSGLCAYLCGYRDAQTLQFSPHGGTLFETHVFGQILRQFRHQAKEVQIHYWRDRDGHEIDFLVETAKGVFPVEVKMGSIYSKDLMKLSDIAEPHWKKAVVISLIHMGEEGRPVALNSEWDRISPFDPID